MQMAYHYHTHSRHSEGVDQEEPSGNKLYLKYTTLGFPENNLVPRPRPQGGKGSGIHRVLFGARRMQHDM